MCYRGLLFLLMHLTICAQPDCSAQPDPAEISFVRQGVKRLIFSEEQSIPLAGIRPEQIIGMASMYPVTHYLPEKAAILQESDRIIISAETGTETGIWFGGFNPFATYSMDIAALSGEGEIGFEFADAEKTQRFLVTAGFEDELLTAVRLSILKNGTLSHRGSIGLNISPGKRLSGRIILQMLGSGFNLYLHDGGLPEIIGQSDFNNYLDLRKKAFINRFQPSLYISLDAGKAALAGVESGFTTGVGLADLRAITYEDGEPLLDRGRLWYTISIRGRALPHHIQGVFSLDPTVFDLRLEGIIAFDRDDGLLRNEIASHIFYDRRDEIWRGTTTGFSAYANPDKEQKQLLAVESQTDPRFGFSIMKAEPFGQAGNIEDPHILFDEEAGKWRIFTCVNLDGFKGIMLEADQWNGPYRQIAGPVKHNSTGTSIQRIGSQRYCFSGSSEREIFIYTYPGLQEAGTLKMDLPPWDETSRTRVWPNVVQLPEGYPVRYVALMMDRYQYPGIEGPHWTYGAVYLYHGHE